MFPFRGIHSTLIAGHSPYAATNYPIKGMQEAICTDYYLSHSKATLLCEHLDTSCISRKARSSGELEPWGQWGDLPSPPPHSCAVMGHCPPRTKYFPTTNYVLVMRNLNCKIYACMVKKMQLLHVLQYAIWRNRCACGSLASSHILALRK